MAVVCVSLSHNTQEILAPYAFTAENEQTYSQLLEGLYLASAKDTLNTRFTYCCYKIALNFLHIFK